MSSFLCFICHNTVSADTNEETREKYKDIVGINLCPDSQLCYVCCHLVNKLWVFKSICYKRSLEYPVLFSEKGTPNLQTNEVKIHIICSEDFCLHNDDTYHRYTFNDNLHRYNYNDKDTQSSNSNDYVKLEDDYNNRDDYHHNGDEVNITDSVNEEPTLNNEFNDTGNNYDMSENILNKEIDINDVGINYLDKYNDIENGFEAELTDERKYASESEKGEVEENRTESDTSKKKKKSKRSKKRDFEKITLSKEEQKTELERQRRTKKYLEAEFKCFNCGLGFLFKDTYQTHMMRHEESNGEYRCVTCTLRFATPALLRSHVVLHAERYKCSKCEQYMSGRQRQTHARKCLNKTGDAASCHLCGRVFQDPRGLQQHLKRFHMTKTSNRTYSCNVCGNNYNNQAAVRTHMLKHIHRKFKCEECEATFSSPYNLTQHKKKHNINKEENKQHYCDTCGVAYSTKKSLLAHKRTAVAHQMRDYLCPYCNRSCPNERALSSHIGNVHSGAKNFCCTLCNARYTNRKSLLRHIRSHTTPVLPKMAVCHLCGNSFKGQSKLNRHLREVCEKDKLEEELSSYYEHNQL